MEHEKQAVYEFWQRASCGEEAYAQGITARERLDAQARERYRLEPYLRGFSRFEDGTGKDVLEIGVGMGADHLEWAKARPRSLTGVDLTERAVAHTRERLESYGLVSSLRTADAEALPFPSNSFDLVYSYGVLHHSPDTARAVAEVLRVLRPGGVARVMIYHKYSMVGYMLWARYALARLAPWRTLEEVYAEHLESPGTKAYSVRDARALFTGFDRVTIRTQLGLGDLLEGGVGQRHRGPLLAAAKRLYPRALIRALLPSHGLAMLIEARK